VGVPSEAAPAQSVSPTPAVAPIDAPTEAVVSGPAASVQADAGGRVLPPPPSRGTESATVQLPFDGAKVLRSILVGNWVAAGAVALTALATSGLLSLILACVAKPTDFGIDNSLTLIAVLMTGAFGADVTVTSNANAFDGGAHVGMFTLTVTIVTFVVTAFAFRRLTARYTGVAAAATDAVRAALLTAVPLTAIALIFRADNDEFGASWASDLATSDQDELVNIGASAVGSFFMPLLLLSVVLWLVCLLRRDWLPDKVARIHDWVAAPLWGVATIAALLPIAGAIGIASVLLFGNDSDTSDLNADEWMTFIGLSVAYLANVGFAVLTLGSGAQMGASGSATARVMGQTENESGDEWHRLAWFTGDSSGVDEPGLWVCVVVVPVVLLVAAFIVARRSRDRDAVLGNLLRFSTLMLVAVPILSRLAALHGGAKLESDGGDVVEFLGEFEGRMTASFYLGSHGLEVTIFLTLFTLIAALLMAATTGAIDVNELKGQAADLARQMQTPPDGQGGSQPMIQQTYSAQQSSPQGQQPAHPSTPPVAPTNRQHPAQPEQRIATQPNPEHPNPPQQQPATRCARGVFLAVAT
jgi:hypothetical protein